MQAILDGLISTAEDGTIPKDHLLSINDISGFEIAPNIEAGFNLIVEEIKQAQSQILIETFVWDKRSPIVQDIKKALIGLGEQGKNIDVFLFIDELGRGAQLAYHGRAQTWPHDPISLGFDGVPANIKIHVGIHHHNSLNSTHVKLVLIDGKTLFLTGANFQLSNYGPKANFDSVLKMQGPIAKSSFHDFVFMWQNRSNKAEESIVPILPISEELEVKTIPVEMQTAVLFATSKPRMASPTWMGHYIKRSLPRNPINIGIMCGIEQAQHIIRIAIPNLNTSYLLHQLANFINKRNGEVEIILGKGFNNKREFFYGGSNDYAVNILLNSIDKDKKDKLRIVWYAVAGEFRNIHLKFWTIDDKITYFSTANLDIISLFNTHEAYVVIDNADFTKKSIATIFTPAFENGVRVTPENVDKYAWQALSKPR